MWGITRCGIKSRWRACDKSRWRACDECGGESIRALASGEIHRCETCLLLRALIRALILVVSAARGAIPRSIPNMICFVVGAAVGIWELDILGTADLSPFSVRRETTQVLDQFEPQLIWQPRPSAALLLLQESVPVQVTAQVSLHHGVLAQIIEEGLFGRWRRGRRRRLGLAQRTARTHAPTRAARIS